MRYYIPDEYNKLTNEQYQKLHEWRSSQKGKDTNKKQPCEAAILAAVTKQVSKEVTRLQGANVAGVAYRPPSDENTGMRKSSMKSFIMSFL